MSKRLQVLLDDAEFREIERIARRNRMTISEWVRRTLQRARRSEPSIDADRKLQAVRTAAGHQFPTADIDQLLDEIDRGRRGEVK